MLNNPHTGQRVRVAEEYRDEWPVHDIGDRIGEIGGVGRWLIVKFGDRTVHIPARFLEAVD